MQCDNCRLALHLDPGTTKNIVLKNTFSLDLDLNIGISRSLARVNVNPLFWPRRIEMEHLISDCKIAFSSYLHWHRTIATY
jgi:hypothetical protein